MTTRTFDGDYAGHTTSPLPALIGGGIAALIFIILAFSSYYTVSQGWVAVLTRNGAVIGESGPGFHLKLPVVDSVTDIPIQPQLDTFEGYDKENPALEAYSQDQQPATIKLNVNYHVTDPMALFGQYTNTNGVEDRLIDPRVVEQVKNIFGQYTAISAIQNRAQLNAQVAQAIQHSVKGPVIIDGVQVTDIAFSKQYEEAVEARMQAIIAQERAIAEKQQRITNADAAAYEVKAQADAQAHATTVRGQAEATAIKARGDALRDNQQLPQLVAAEKWDGKLPETMVPGGAVPFLNVHGSANGQ